MFQVRPLILGSVVFLCCCVAFGQESPGGVNIEITQVAGNYVVTVPVSRLVMTIPKGNLSRVSAEAVESSRYFLFEDEALHLIITGWFDSDQGYPGIKRFWADETAAWKEKNFPEAQNVSFVQVGKWNAILYDIKVPTGNNSHIRAHWVQAGTWIDIHLSLTADLPRAELRAKLRDFLKSIQVAEKP